MGRLSYKPEEPSEMSDNKLLDQYTDTITQITVLNLLKEKSPQFASLRKEIEDRMEAGARAQKELKDLKARNAIDQQHTANLLQGGIIE